MRIVVTDRVRAERFVGTKPYAVISVSGPTQTPAALSDDANRVATLRLRCDDIGHYHDPTMPALMYFSTEDAEAVLDFVEGLHTPRLIIHCEAGISRSRGIAVALAAIYGDSFAHAEHGMPNPHIVKTILDRHHERTGIAIATPAAIRSKTGCPNHPGATHDGGVFDDDHGTCSICHRPLVVVRHWDVLDLARAFGLEIDLHAQNMMRRPKTGQLVFTDPVTTPS